MTKINVYAIANIHPTHCEKIERICNLLDGRFDIFMPHKHNEYNLDNKKIQLGAFRTDKEAMDKSDMALVVMPLYGRDCASEIGYCQGKDKCIVAYVDQMRAAQERDWLNDWMVKGFLNYIITPDQEAYSILLSDELLKEKQIRFSPKQGDIVRLILNNEFSSNLVELMNRKMEE